ncbi:MAG: hypothetical protein H6722_04520 [Sandaracinus sp.]|nr:hypothetical protein [Myxococcales bacterium]MCB9611702.1 hypothetical protein [Sandaracinus sp.]
MRPFLFALLLATIAGVLGAYGFRRSRYAAPVPPELARAAYAREVAVATQLGFEPAVGPSEDPLFTDEYGSAPVVLRRFELAEGECVAAVAAVHGWGKLSKLRLSRQCPTHYAYRDPNDLSVQENVGGVVSQVQFCAWEPMQVELCASGFRMSDDPMEKARFPAIVTHSLLRAPAERVGASLNRGFVTLPPPQVPGLAAEVGPPDSVASPDVVPSNTVRSDATEEGPSRSDILVAMRAVAENVRRCPHSGAVNVTVRVTFQPDGSVREVDGSGQAEDTLRCVEEAVRAARVPPYSPTRGDVIVQFPFVFR